MSLPLEDMNFNFYCIYLCACHNEPEREESHWVEGHGSQRPEASCCEMKQGNLPAKPQSLHLKRCVVLGAEQPPSWHARSIR